MINAGNKIQSPEEAFHRIDGNGKRMERYEEGGFGRLQPRSQGWKDPQQIFRSSNPEEIVFAAANSIEP